MRGWLGNTLERFRLLEAARPQMLRANYRVTLVNHASVLQRVGIAIPVPPERSHQHLLSAPIFLPEDVQFQTDQFGNRIAFWERLLQPYEAVDARMQLAMQTHPAVQIENQSSSIDWMQKSRFLSPTDSRVISLSMIGATSGERRRACIHRLHQIVSDRLTYGHPIPGLYSANEAIENQCVDCGGFATLCCSLALARGIPARVVTGFWSSSTNADMHAWAEAQLEDGSWIPVDGSVQQLRTHGRTHRRGGCGFVGSDRIVYAIGCGMTVQMCGLSIPVDILQHPVISAEKGLSTLKIDFFHTVTSL